jgi:hypothetical protein
MLAKQKKNAIPSLSSSYSPFHSLEYMKTFGDVIKARTYAARTVFSKVTLCNQIQSPGYGQQMVATLPIRLTRHNSWGSFSRFTMTKIWKAYVEPKCMMSSWLVLHGKILTADRLAVRGWPHDPMR